MAHQHIDLNSDLGESFGPWNMGDDRAMLAIVTSANIACGGHAGDPETMFKTLTLAAHNNVAVGAHPGYNDREGFGRRIIPMSMEAIAHMCAAQIGALIAMTKLTGSQKVSYVKPHGALANLAARDRQVAQAISATVKMIDPELAILAISGTEMEQAARAANITVFSEIFADRAYLPSGQLVPRDQDGAMIHDPKTAADRLVKFLQTGFMPVQNGDPIALDAHSICVHGDSPNAVAIAKEIRSRLRAENIEVSSFT